MIKPPPPPILAARPKSIAQAGVPLWLFVVVCSAAFWLGLDELGEFCYELAYVIAKIRA